MGTVPPLAAFARLVFSRELWLFTQLPVDGQRRVAPANATFGRWGVVVGSFVENSAKSLRTTNLCAKPSEGP